MQIDRRLVRFFDWQLSLTVAAILVVGLVAMYSASLGRGGDRDIFLNHLARVGVGTLSLVAAFLVDYRTLARYSPLIFALNLLALLVVDLAGVIGLGARRWLSLGPVSMQPSELFKLAFILMLATYLGRWKQEGPLSRGELLATLGFFAVPFLLILKQPDLGTAGIVSFIYAAMVLVNGLGRQAWRAIGATAAAVILLGLLLWKTGVLETGHLLKPYQLRRLEVLVNPEADPLGASYHVNQSKIAVGSGGVTGKGFLNGSQNRLRFLPQQHTDFIFSVLAEEWGFLGATAAVVLFGTLLLLGLRVAMESRDHLGSLIALGVTAMIFFHVVINIGMTLGIMPVVGIPLPLISYGGTFHLVNMMGIGLLLNVRMRRYNL